MFLKQQDKRMGMMVRINLPPTLTLYPLPPHPHVLPRTSTAAKFFSNYPEIWLMKHTHSCGAFIMSSLIRV